MKPRIIFMGTPEFAVASLDKLYNEGFEIAAVVTAPDKPAGRGLQISESAVKKYAVSKNIKILQPVKLKDPAFLSELIDLKADLQIVVAFRMLPEIVWNMPPMGTLNLHGSLLPQYRGAAPINWAIINGEKFTGVTTFKLLHEIDTGNILEQEIIPIGDKETAGELHDKMKEVGASLLVKTVYGLNNNTITEKPQYLASSSKEILKHAPKIFTETCQINWNNNIQDIFNLIRGLSPYPAAFTFLNDKKIKVFNAEIQPSNDQLTPGKIESDNKLYLKFSAANGYVFLKEIQPEGKKRMYIEDYLRGNKVNTK